MSSKETYGDHLFSQDRLNESIRLDSIAQAYDPVSRAQIRALNIENGMRCLDVGSGQGSVAFWLADQPELADGEVVALDRDVRLLEQRAGARGNLRVVQHDIHGDDHTLGLFDLVHARFVLMHLVDRVNLLRRLASWVKPGGWIILSDSVDLTTHEAAFAPYRQAMAAMWSCLSHAIGTDVQWSRTIPDHLRNAGFEKIGVEVYLPSVSSDSPINTFWQHTWAQMKDRLVSSSNIDPESLEAAIEALRGRDFVELSPGMLTCWGQRPTIA